MEFSLPEFPTAPGAQAAFAAVCFLILVGLLFLIFPVSVGRFLGLESRETRPGAVGELRAAGGLLAGLAIATLMFDQPVLYTALAIALLISTFGRILSLMSDSAATLFNFLLLSVQIVLTGATLYYFFDVFTPDFNLWKPVCWILLAAGIWVSRPILRRGAILWLVMLFGVVVTLAAFGYARLFLQSAPFLFLFQVAAVVALASRLRTHAARRAAALAGAALAAALILELAVAAAHPRNFRATGSVDPMTGKLLQDAAVNLEPVP